jgi:hypothetical protein
MEPQERREEYVNSITETDQVIGNKYCDAAE